MRARAHLQLVADALHMRAYGLCADRKLRRDVAREAALGDEQQHFALAHRQGLWRRAAGLAHLIGHGSPQPHEKVPHHVRRYGRAAIDDLQHRLREVLEPRVLEQIARGARRERTAHMGLVLQRRVHDDLRRAAMALGALDQVETLASPQAHVEDQHVELELRQQPLAFQHAARLADDTHARIHHQFVSDRAPRAGVLVDQQHPHRLFCLAGQKTRPWAWRWPVALAGGGLLEP